MHKKAQGAFANPNVFFYRRNVLGGAVLAPRSVDTTLTFALTHEIWSYGDGWPRYAGSCRRSTTHAPAGCGSTVTCAGRRRGPRGRLRFEHRRGGAGRQRQPDLARRASRCEA